MGVMDKFLSYMRLNGEDDYDDYDEDDYDDYDEPVEKISKLTPKTKSEPVQDEEGITQGNTHAAAPQNRRQRDGSMCD